MQYRSNELQTSKLASQQSGKVAAVHELAQEEEERERERWLAVPRMRVRAATRNKQIAFN